MKRRSFLTVLGLVLPPLLILALVLVLFVLLFAS